MTKPPRTIKGKKVEKKILGRVKVGWRPFGVKVALYKKLDYFVRKGWLYIYEK